MTDYHCKTNLSVLREMLQMFDELIINWVLPTILLPILIYNQGLIIFKIDILIFFHVEDRDANEHFVSSTQHNITLSCHIVVFLTVTLKCKDIVRWIAEY